MSQVDKVLPTSDNVNDLGDVKLHKDSGSDNRGVPSVVSSTFSSSITGVISVAMNQEQEPDETGLLSRHAQQQLEQPDPDGSGGGGGGGGQNDGDIPTAVAYEPCDPLIILNLFQSLSSTTNSLELGRA